MEISSQKQYVASQIEAIKDKLYEISQYIGHHPELGHEEYEASRLLSEELAAHGFEVEKATLGIETAFTAIFDSGKPGPKIGFMAEYDALPGLGHGCGHNLIGTMAVGSAAALSKVLHETGGKLYVYGTPAEETKGAKVTMAEHGLFDHLDAAMMIHPSSSFTKSGTSLAMDAIQFEFFGKAAHAAAAPEKGINALDAVIQTFNGINALRQHVTSDVRIHGVIPKGGEAANIVPDYAMAQFYVRAADRLYLNDVRARVENCAKAAALATSARLETSFYEYSYDDMKTNEPLSDVFTDNLTALGVPGSDIQEQNEPGGSLDMGNVSSKAPAIHPYIRITGMPYAAHTKEFRDAALSEEGFEGMLLGAKAMAWTAYDLLTDETLAEKVKAAF